jgi:hypothetical protein
VFNFASELDQTHDAYSAALANPLPERAAEAVRRLVQALVDRGQLQQLLSLPWAGVLLLNRDGLQEPVPVVEVGVHKCCCFADAYPGASNGLKLVGVLLQQGRTAGASACRSGECVQVLLLCECGLRGSFDRFEAVLACCCSAGMDCRSQCLWLR